MKPCPKCGKANEMPFHTCKPFPADDELNLAMCEWMGWKVTTNACGIPPTPTRFSMREGYDALPDYLSDDSPRRLLNEAEARLTEQCKEHDYWFFLRELLGFSEAQCDWGEVDYFKAVSATARQRVIAILQTIKPEMFQ